MKNMKNKLNISKSRKHAHKLYTIYFFHEFYNQQSIHIFYHRYRAATDPMNK